VVHKHPVRSGGWQRVGGHRVLGEAHMVAGRWEDVATEIGVPDASIARDVQSLS